MKCPKCGYNSFEYQDSCKKCAHDLSGYKATYGLKAIVLPQAARVAMAESFGTETVEADQTAETPETASDMFSFDLPEEEAAPQAPTTAADDNPFDFDEEPAAAPTQGFAEFSFDEEPAATPPQGFAEFSFDEEPKSAQAKAEEDAFANLLESSSQEEEAAAAATPAAPASFDSGEFDLESFSWDETPAAPAESGEEAGAKSDADLDNLFGDLDDTSKK